MSDTDKNKIIGDTEAQKTAAQAKAAHKAEEEAREEKELAQLKEAIRDLATEEEKPQSASFTLRKILGGDFLSAEILKRQTGVIVLIVFFALVYVSNRYSCQKDLLEINELKEKLEDARYKSLASSSELTEMCRESNVLEMLRSNKDSVLHVASQPPYIINVPQE